MVTCNEWMDIGRSVVFPLVLVNLTNTSAWHVYCRNIRWFTSNRYFAAVLVHAVICIVLYRTVIMLRAIRAMLCCLLKQCMSNNKWHSCAVQPIWVTFRLSSLWHNPSTSRALYIVTTTAQILLLMSYVSSMIRMHVCPCNCVLRRTLFFVLYTLSQPR